MDSLLSLPVVALLFTPTKKHIFTGVLQGKLTYPPRGKFGFGYDPIFYS